MALLAPVFAIATVGLCQAAASTRLEVFADRQAPITAQHEWLQRLAEVGVTDLRFRAQEPGDAIGIEKSELAGDIVYRVTARLDSRSNLVFPGAVFRIGEARQVTAWLKDLAEKGPLESREKKAAFGLTESQFKRLQLGLAKPNSLVAKDLDRAEAIRRIVEQSAVPIRVRPKLLALAEGEKIQDELAGLSSGTTLSYLLQSAELCLVPKMEGSGGVVCEISALRSGAEIWPIGWTPEKSIPELLPKLYQTFNANVDGVPVQKVLDAIGKRLETPFLVDRIAMARYHMDLTKMMTTLPPTRTTYNSLLRKVLAQAKMRFEVRVDDAGNPFLWITTMRSP
jgi:hypothetical protein